MNVLGLVWGGISCFVAVCSLVVAVLAWRTSAAARLTSVAAQRLDEKIELAIQRFEKTLDTKLDATFVNAEKLKLQLEVFDTKLAGFDHRLKRNSVNMTIVTRELMKKGYTLAMQPGDVIDD